MYCDKCHCAVPNTNIILSELIKSKTYIMKPNIGISEEYRDGINEVLSHVFGDQFVLNTKTRNIINEK